MSATTVAPSTFTGTLHRVIVQVDGDPHVDAAAEARAAMMSQ